jgi:UDP-N-acetylmuramate dehydrogenase
MVSPTTKKTGQELLNRKVALKDLTTWHVGGPARFLCRPGSSDDLKRAVNFARKRGLDYRMIGNGSNVLVPDQGFDGLIIKFGHQMSGLRKSGGSIRAEAGASLYELAKFANETGSQSFNFLAGIPGTIGGGIAMNAGAHGKEISDYLLSVTYINRQGEINTTSDFSDSFGYRESPFGDNDRIVLEAEFKPNDRETQPEMSHFLKSRRERIPYEERTAGSVFKNPPSCNKTAGELLDEAGSKGLRVGDAVVSRKHANFILNKGHATAKNIQKTIDILRDRVYKEFGVTLVTEIVVI